MKTIKLILLAICLFCSFNSFSQAATGQIYFLRYTGTKGALVNMSVYIDGKLICKLKNNRYSIHSIAPGVHTVSVKSGGIPIPKLDALQVTVANEKVNYIQLVNASKLYCQEINKNSADLVLKKLKQTTDCETKE